MATKTPDNPKLPEAKKCAKALESLKTVAQVKAWTKQYMGTLGYKAVGRILIGESPEMSVAAKAERREMKGT